MSLNASKRTRPDGRQHTTQMMSFVERNLLELDHTRDTLGLIRWRDKWREDPVWRPDGVDAEDLLGIAIAQGLPHAFEAWAGQGDTVNGDVLLSLFGAAVSCDHFVYEQWATLGRHFTGVNLAPWHGALFTHLAYIGLEDLALGMVDQCLVAANTPVPASGREAEDWLWSWDAAARNHMDSSLPINVALDMGRWHLAEGLVVRGADLLQPDGRGVTPVDEIAKHLEVQIGAYGSQKNRDMTQMWYKRITSLQDAQTLENDTLAPQVDSGHRRRL